MEEDARRNIVSCKHSAARTGVEQDADVCPGVKVLKWLEKLMNYEDIYTFNIGLLGRLNTGIRCDVKRVNLETSKIKAIVHFLSRMPALMRQAYVPENLQQGFLGNGQIDAKSRSVPDILSIVGTDAAGRLSGHHFRQLFQWFYDPMMNNGHIDEHLSDDHGVPLNRNSSGEVVPKYHGISSEHRQRSKILSHKKQRELRRKLREDKQLAILTKQWKYYFAEQKIANWLWEPPPLFSAQ